MLEHPPSIPSFPGRSIGGPTVRAGKVRAGKVRAGKVRAGGFSLLELVITVAVAIILTGLLLPSLGKVREHAHRLVCSANLRQIGLAFAMYDRDSAGRLPYSWELDKGHHNELMVAFIGNEEVDWDGLGLLYAGGYCSAAECFYCPSHTGGHTADQYDWQGAVRERIYANYHYSGHCDWQDPMRKRSLDEGDKLLLATDGFKNREDWNHQTGTNMLRGDCSVNWFEDTWPEPFVERLPVTGAPPPPDFRTIWRSLERGRP